MVERSSGALAGKGMNPPERKGEEEGTIRGVPPKSPQSGPTSSTA